MTVQQRKERIKMNRRKQVARQKLCLSIVVACLITVGSIVCGTIFSSAKNPAEDIPQYKYYKSITIQQGDSLWSIAQEYNADSEISMQEYIDELVQVNGLKSKTIHAGQHLVVAYYDTELR